MIQRIVISLILAAGLAACATPNSQPPKPVQNRVQVPDALPETLGDQGLVVAAIAANTVAASLFEQLSFSMAGITLGDTYYANAVRDNYLVLPLKPGSYTLESLHVYRSRDDQSTTRYPLGYKFRIAAGQATNLGLITLVAQSGQEKRYWKVLVDNSKEMHAYLSKRHPKLAAALPGPPARAQENTYAQGSLVDSTRRDIARDAWSTSEEPDLAHYVGGQVGTIAKVLRDSQGRLAAFDVLATQTTSAMLSCSGHEQRFVCSSDEPALYFVQGIKVEKRPLNLPVKHVWVHAFAPRGLVLVDEHMNVYSSNDNGASWSKYVWHARKDPLHYLARIKFVNGKNGYYIYSTFTADPLVPQVIYSELGRAAYRPVDIPKMNNWQRLIETPEGLLAGPLNSERKDNASTLYFRPAGRSEWQPRSLPGNRCFFLQYEGQTKEKLRVYCDSKFFISTDGGRVWKEKAAAEPAMETK